MVADVGQHGCGYYGMLRCTHRNPVGFARTNRSLTSVRDCAVPAICVPTGALGPCDLGLPDGWIASAVWYDIGMFHKG